VACIGFNLGEGYKIKMGSKFIHRLN